MLIYIFMMYITIYADCFTTVSHSNMGENEIVENIRVENDKIEEDNEIDCHEEFKKRSWVWN